MHPCLFYGFIYGRLSILIHMPIYDTTISKQTQACAREAIRLGFNNANGFMCLMCLQSVLLTTAGTFWPSVLFRMSLIPKHYSPTAICCVFWELSREEQGVTGLPADDEVCLWTHSHQHTERARTTDGRGPWYGAVWSLRSLGSVDWNGMVFEGIGSSHLFICLAT